MSSVKRDRVDNRAERSLATGVIVSERVLREIQTIYNPDYVRVPYVRRLVEWSLDYFKTYQKPPGKHIQDIFHAHERKGMDEDEAALISDFLEEISGEHERADKFNEQYLLHQVEERFKTVSLQNLSEDIQAELSNGNILKAEALLSEYRRVALPSSDGIDPLDNVEVIQEAFEHHAEPLFTLPGAAGDMLNEQLVRGGLIGIMGRAKIGKTFNCMELTMRALKARCNVAFFQAGDETQEGMTTRFHVRLAGRSNIPRYCREMWVPVLDCDRNQENTCNAQCREGKIGTEGKSPKEAPTHYKPCSICANDNPHKFRGTVWYTRQPAAKPLTWREAYQEGQKFKKRMKGRKFKMITVPNGTLSVQDICAYLDKWEHFEGWIPDVVIIDYADILAPEPEALKKETRDQQNATWKALRRLSQQRHCLVIAPTQANAASYDAYRLKLTNFSEDRRKYDHVTGMLGLNQTEAEKKAGIMRWNWLLLRHGEFDTREMVVVLQCLQKGRPLLGSYKLRPKKTSETKDHKSN